MKRLFILFALLSFVCSAYSQTKMFIHTTTVTDSFRLSDIKTITFKTEPDTGLVAWYPFNGNANDLSGNGLNGVVSGATLTTDRFNVSNQAYSFDGNSDSIRVENSNLLNFGSLHGFTISTWIKLNGTQVGSAGVISKAKNVGDWAGYQLLISADSKIMMELDSASKKLNFTGTKNINDGSWHHIALVVNRAADSAHVFIDDTLEITKKGLANYDNNDPLRIGVERQMNKFFKGSIDDIFIFDRALSDAEVLKLYQRGGL